MSKDKEKFGKWLAKVREDGISIICPRGLKVKEKGFSPADADFVRAAGIEFRIWGVNSPELLAYARDLKVPVATCSKWAAVFEWAKDIPGIEVAP